MNNQTDNNQLAAVLKIISRLAQKSDSGDYIYRGEPECYEKVSSRLYRVCKDIKVDGFDIEVVQQEILRDAKRYTTRTDEFEILNELQHYGGDTNLIDLTTDYLIALFFACNSSADKDGRVILLKRTSISVQQPRIPLNRVIAQKSRFTRPEPGFIEPEKDKVIKIPKDLKPHILTHLQKSHGISTETIYNDLHGFIRNRSTHQSTYTEFYRALTYQNKGDNEEDQDKATEHYDNAIKHYDKAIELKPDFARAYNGLGFVYHEKGKFDEAIKNYNRAIECQQNLAEAYSSRGAAYEKKDKFDEAIKDHNQAIEYQFRQPDNHALAYYNRGVVWLCKQTWGKAKSDLNDAKEKGTDIAKTFSEDYGSDAAFEKRYQVQLPKCIKDMLTA